MIKTPPIETQDIFDYLTKGYFISGDSEMVETKQLFRVIEEEDNYEVLLNYYSRIGYQLIKGHDYFYFSKRDSNKKLEDKLKATYKWIDIFDFFLSYGESKSEYISAGSIFTPSQIFNECKVNNALIEKLNSIQSIKNIEKPLDKINKLIEELVKATFAEKYNEFHNEYKIVAAFAYLEQLIKTIDITDENEDTTPE